MKLLLCAAFIAILHLMIGCVSLQYQGVEYMRVGDQHIKNLIIETTAPDGSKFYTFGIAGLGSNGFDERD